MTTLGLQVIQEESAVDTTRISSVCAGILIIGGAIMSIKESGFFAAVSVVFATMCLLTAGCGGGGSSSKSGATGGSSSTTTTTTTIPSTTPASLTSDFMPPSGAASGPASAGGYGPWNLRLLTATSSDGITFHRNNKLVTDQGDVSDLVVDGKGWIYLYYVGWTVGTAQNKTVVAISTDNGQSWAYKYLVLSGFDGLSEPVDPDIQLLADGTFRLYLTSNPNDNQGARTYYAEGTDGINFTNKGVAFAQPGQNVMDPTTLWIGNEWIYFAGSDSPGEVWCATSTDGKIFSACSPPQKEFTVGTQKYGMVNGIAVNGGYRFYSSGRDLRSFFSADGLNWADSGAALAIDTSTGLEGNFIKEPAVAKLPDGKYLMVYSASFP